MDTSWVILLPDFINGPEVSNDQFSAQEQELIDTIRASGDHLLQILQPLGPYLTTENDTSRSKATILLGKVGTHAIPTHRFTLISFSSPSRSYQPINRDTRTADCEGYTAMPSFSI